MRPIEFSEIRLRLKSLNNNLLESNTTLEERIYNDIDSFNTQDIVRFIENADNISFQTYLRLFDALCESGTTSEISKMGMYITEKALPKVRDAKSTLALLKGRLTRTRNKMFSPISDQLQSVASQFKSKLKLPSVPSTPMKSKAVKEAYENMINKIERIIHCDRVLENYNSISKRFNLEILFNENTRINGVRDTIVELCKRIDTYDIPDSVKFNTVIETALYGFGSNNLDFKKSEILETAIDYFFLKGNGVDAYKEILEATLFFDKEKDMGNIDIITEEEPEMEEKINIDDTIRNETQISTKNHAISIREETDFNEIFKKFKEEEASKDENGRVSRLKNLVNKLYSRDVNSIAKETPDLLRWIRLFFIVSTGAVPLIGPVLMVIGLIADKFIMLHMDIKEYKAMLDCFEKEIKESEKKMESLEDEESKERMKKYIEALEKAKDKIYGAYLDVYDDSYDEEEETKEDNSNTDIGDNNNDDDWDDFDFDDDFDNFDESTISPLKLLGKIEETTNELISFVEDHPLTSSDMYNIIKYLDDDNLENLTEIANEFPDTFHKDSIISAMEDNLKELRQESFVLPLYQKVLRKFVVKKCLDILKNKKNNGLKLTKKLGLFESFVQLNTVDQAYRSMVYISDIIRNDSTVDKTLIENSIANKLKMASIKLQSAMKTLKDKDKQISKTIDISANNFKKAVEKSLTNDNRESIIKGSILPSASKIMHLCIINAGLMFLGTAGVATAIIGTLGYLGTQKAFKAKERQMIIDELEIELKMCKKYIDIAESKNDMKALKQLMTQQRELERQLQRIKYKMKVNFGQKYFDTQHVDEH